MLPNIERMSSFTVLVGEVGVALIDGVTELFPNSSLKISIVSSFFGSEGVDGIDGLEEVTASSSPSISIL